MQDLAPIPYEVEPFYPKMPLVQVLKFSDLS